MWYPPQTKARRRFAIIDMGLGRQRSNFAHKISRQLFNEHDLTSLVIAKRSSIRIYVIRGDDINEYLNICSTGKTKGTIIG